MAPAITGRSRKRSTRRAAATIIIRPGYIGSIKVEYKELTLVGSGSA
ncbi:MAG: hypothetical protein U1E76_21635 [Planctomycetota bacterium]